MNNEYIMNPRPGFRALPYRSGNIYNWFAKKMYDQTKKYASISKIIGQDKIVLDLPCGTGYLTRFLHPTTDYEGWDLNHRFLKKLLADFRRGRIKLKKIKLKQQNIFDFENYPKKDTIVFCDILHHIFPKHIELVENAKKYARKIIICEPIAIRPSNIKARNKFFRFIIYFARTLPEGLIKIIDFLFGDNDGINSYNNRDGWRDHNEDSLKDLYESIGIFSNKIYRICDDLLGIWEEN